MLHLNAEFHEELAVALSLKQPEPVAVFTEFDQAAWGYCLCHAGQRLDVFWSDPDYLDVEPSACAGDAEIFGKTVGVDPAAIAGYLVPPVEGVKVHADDAFTLDDHWVRVDFMRHVGIQYPDLTGENGRHVVVRR